MILSKPPAIFGISGQRFELGIERPEMSVHPLIHKNGEVKTDKKGGAVVRRYFVKVLATILPTMAEVGQTMVWHECRQIRPKIVEIVILDVHQVQPGSFQTA
jgi:hypothetical protein